MASPPHVSSPLAMSPPYPSPAQLPNKKRSSTMDVNGPPGKRRKPSQQSSTVGTPSHPLRNASFPAEARSPYARSPSVEASSHVSGSAVSGVTADRAPKKKRGRKARNAKNAGADDDQASSLAGGRAATNVSGQGGDKDGEEDEDEDKAEMALEDVVARTQEQKQEEIRLRAMLVEAFDTQQYNRYELWRAAKLADAVVKRVVNATVSQSVPQNVSTAVKAVAKLFAGEIIEAARAVQGEWIAAGEEQTDLPQHMFAALLAPARDTPPSTNGGQEMQDGEAQDREKVEREKEEKERKAVEADIRRGPLRPDHLREAWRRYRFTGESRGVGVQQLWHAQASNGVERFSTKTGKRLFK